MLICWNFKSFITCVYNPSTENLYPPIVLSTAKLLLNTDGILNPLSTKFGNIGIEYYNKTYQSKKSKDMNKS